VIDRPDLIDLYEFWTLRLKLLQNLQVRQHQTGLGEAVERFEPRARQHADAFRFQPVFFGKRLQLQRACPDAADLACANSARDGQLLQTGKLRRVKYFREPVWGIRRPDKKSEGRLKYLPLKSTHSI